MPKRTNKRPAVAVTGTGRSSPRSISRSSTARRLVLFLCLFLIVGISLYAHVTVYPDAANYTGPLALLDRVFDVVFAWSLLALSFCVGRTCCAALSIPFAGLAEEFAFSVFTGMGALALAVLGLGLAGLLKPIPAAALALLSILISHRQIPRLALLLTGALNAATLSRQRVIVALLLVALALMLVLRAATPPHSFDEAIYHLAITKSFVARGRVFPVVENWAGDMPFLVHMIYALCLMAKADIAAKVFSCLLALTCALGIYAFCSRFLDKTTGAIAMLVFFAAGMVVEVAVTARIDVSLAAVLFLATYAMFVCLESKNEPGAGRWLFLSGIMSGLALGIKYSAGIWIALLGLVFVFESLRTRKRSILELAKHGGGFVLIAFLLSSPWFAKNLVWFHNPVYPFVTGEVAQVGNGTVRFFGPEDSQKAETFFDQAKLKNPQLMEDRAGTLANKAAQGIERHPWEFWEYFLRPDDYNMAEDFHYPNYLFLFLPFLLFLPADRWLKWLLTLSVLFFLAVTWSSWVGRILLPVYPPLTIGSAYVLTRLVGLRLPFSRTKPEPGSGPSWKASLFPLTAALLVIVGLSVSQLSENKDLEFIAGGISRRDFMSQMFYYPPIDFINRELPQSAGVLMIGAQMYYDVDRKWIPDIDWDSTEWRRLLASSSSWDGLNDTLKKRGITHVLYTDSLYQWAALMGRKNYPVVSGIERPPGSPDYYTQLENWVTFDAYSANYLQMVYSDKMGYLVYKLK